MLFYGSPSRVGHKQCIRAGFTVSSKFVLQRLSVYSSEQGLLIRVGVSLPSPRSQVIGRPGKVLIMLIRVSLAKGKGTVLSEHTLLYKLFLTKAGQDQGRTRLLVRCFQAKFEDIKQAEAYPVGYLLSYLFLSKAYPGTDPSTLHQLPSQHGGRVHQVYSGTEDNEGLPGRLVLHLV